MIKEAKKASSANWRPRKARDEIQFEPQGLRTRSPGVTAREDGHLSSAHSSAFLFYYSVLQRTG